jgi:hypothetical protein
MRQQDVAIGSIDGDSGGTKGELEKNQSCLMLTAILSDAAGG